MALRRSKKRGTKPGLTVETVPIDSITTHPKNAREHSERNVQIIARSLDRYGQRTPLVLGRQADAQGRPYILKGNGTYEALKRLGAPEVAVSRADNLTPEQEDAYALADNVASDTSEFNSDTLGVVLRGLEQAGVDLADTGFNLAEVEPLLEATPPSKDAPPADPPAPKGYAYVPLLFFTEAEAERVKNWFRETTSFNGKNGLERGKAFLDYLDEIGYEGKPKRPQPKRRK